MKRKLMLSVSALMLLGIGHSVYANDDLTKQIQMQLQQIQDNQEKQRQALNTQIQAQLKKMQADLQKEIQNEHNITQAQIKKIQDTLQDQIQQVNANVIKVSKMK